MNEKKRSTQTTHAPIIFPAVMGVSIPYRTSFYGHLIVLHASLLVREIGDLAGWVSIRRWGGLLNVVAVLLFLVSTVYASRQAAVQEPASN